MQPYKREFIDFMVRAGVLSFGEFTTKSGRKSPFFINTGRYRTGAQIARLGEFYAECIQDRIGLDRFELLFGPAYKGIPLAVAASIALATKFGADRGFCFNRKEAKDHGEGGSLVGQAPAAGDRVLLIEDVVTAGTAVREVVPLVQAAGGVKLAGLVVSVDRQERGKGKLTALAELADELAMPAVAIVTLDEVMTHLESHAIDGKRLISRELKDKIEEYRSQYGGSDHG
ncbi:MAG: orotate phosphoribosyltransferase [Bdellovibrionales bacterium]|nr:orotate phosphoribosyltransferase [Bdellovibrionales bacterium]